MGKIEFTTPIVDIIEIKASDILTESDYTYGDDNFFLEEADKSWNW